MDSHWAWCRERLDSPISMFSQNKVAVVFQVKDMFAAMRRQRSETSTLSRLSAFHRFFGSQDAIYLPNVSKCIRMSYQQLSTWDKWSWDLNLPGSLQLYDVANPGAPRWTWRTGNWRSGELIQVVSVWFQMFPHIKMKGSHQLSCGTVLVAEYGFHFWA